MLQLLGHVGLPMPARWLNRVPSTKPVPVVEASTGLSASFTRSVAAGLGDHRKGAANLNNKGASLAVATRSTHHIRIEKVDGYAAGLELTGQLT